MAAKRRMRFRRADPPPPETVTIGDFDAAAGEVLQATKALSRAGFCTYEEGVLLHVIRSAQERAEERRWQKVRRR